MRKFIALATALLASYACSESGPTDPNLSPRYGVKTPVPNPDAPQVCPEGAGCSTFDGFSASDEEFGIAAVPVTLAPSGESFGGRWANQTVTFSPANPDQVTLTFNLYVVGNWLGNQKKDPDHIWQLAYKCGDNPETLIVNATIANKIGNYQSFPENVDVGHHGGQYGAANVSALQYAGSGQTNYSTGRGDVADTEYAVQKTIPSCNGLARSILMRAINLPGNVSDASWGIDNVSIQ